LKEKNMDRVILIVLFLIFIFVKAVRPIMKANKLSNILFTEKNPEKYVSQFDEMFKKFQLPKTLYINLIRQTTGMIYAGRFEEAIDILTNRVKQIPRNWEPILYQNLIMSLYLNGETERGNDTLKTAIPFFKKYVTNQYFIETLGIVYNVSDFYNGATDTKEFFERISRNGSNDYRKAIGYYYLARLEKIDGNKEKAEACFNSAIEYGKGSVFERFSRDELNNIDLPDPVTEWLAAGGANKKELAADEFLTDEIIADETEEEFDEIESSEDEQADENAADNSDKDEPFEE
jgi:tetratricopeptide (TPR) repeat protein